MNAKSQWVLYICLGLLMVIFGCSMEVSLLTARNSEPAKAGFGFVILGGLYLIIEKGFKSKPSKDASEIELEKEKVLQSPLIQDERVVNFFQTTLNAWSSGKLSDMGQNYEESAREMQPGNFIKVFPPYKGSALRALFDDFQPLEGEFLVGVGNIKNTNINNTSWFVLTNLRLIQKDSRDKKFKEVTLAEVDTYQSKGESNFTLVFKMKSGEEITFEKLPMRPTEKALDWVLSQRFMA